MGSPSPAPCVVFSGWKAGLSLNLCEELSSPDESSPFSKICLCLSAYSSLLNRPEPILLSSCTSDASAIFNRGALKTGALSASSNFYRRSMCASIAFFACSSRCASFSLAWRAFYIRGDRGSFSGDSSFSGAAKDGFWSVFFSIKTKLFRSVFVSLDTLGCSGSTTF